MGLRSSSLYSELRLKPIPHHRAPKRFLLAEKLNQNSFPTARELNTKNVVLEEVVLVFGRAKF